MTSQRELVLGVDSSTTSCKVLAFDRDGVVVAEGRAALELQNPEVGAWEQSPAEIWAAFVEAARACVAALDPSLLRGVAIAHQRETFVVTDDDGVALAPALTWMDHRCRDEVRTAVAAIGEERIHRISGKPACTTPSLYKWLGLRARRPALANVAVRLEDVHAFLVRHLTGERVTSLASADPMGLVDMQARGWSNDLLTFAGLEPTRQSRLVEVGARIGCVSEQASRVTGLPAGLPVFAGAGDGQAAGLGAGIAAPGRAYLNLGTAVVSGVLSSTYVVERAFRTLYGGLPETYFLETDLQGGTFTVTWLCEKLLREPLTILPTLEAEAATIAPGSDGLLLVPYWNGVMNPYWDDFASGLLVGLRGDHGRAHLYRALLEGIAFEERLHARGVEAAVGRIDEFVVMGGGASSALWCQILADVLERPVVRAATREATALGAAMIAATGAGLFATLADAAIAMSRVGARFEAGAARSFYADRFERTYRHVYPALRPLLLGSPGT